MHRFIPAAMAVLLLTGGCGMFSRAPRTTSPAVRDTAVTITQEIQLPDDIVLGDIPVQGYPVSRSVWIDSTLAGLSARQRIAQLLVPFSFANLEEKTLRALARSVRGQGVGGVLLSRGTETDARTLIDSLRQWAAIPLLLTADFENGPGMRLQGALELPSMMGLAATRSPDLAYRAGRAVAEEALDIGFHMNFAPVADINSNPENPIINVRSFGEDRELVADMTEAYARGMQDAGLIATAKHFPGHGDTDVDSHTGLPMISATRARLDSVELYPFRRLVDAGILSVMTAHIALPALTGDSTLPATLSRVVLDSLLRKELGFRGLIVTDAMNMKALTRTGVRNLPATALGAGADLLLIPGDIEESIDSVQAAIARGELDSVRVYRSVRRVLAYKEWAQRHRMAVDSTGTRLERRARNRRLAEDIAERAATLLRNDGVLLPLQIEGKRIGIISLVRRSEPAGAKVLRRELSLRGAQVSSTLLPLRDGRDAARWIRDSLPDMDLLLLASYLTVADGSGSIGLSDSQRETLQEVLQQDLPAVLLAFGSPYIVSMTGEVPAQLLLYGDDAPSVRAAVKVLTGDVEATGTLPVRIPSHYAFGSGVHMNVIPARAGVTMAFAGVDSLIGSQIAARSFPGGQLAVLCGGRVLYSRNYGALSYDSASPPVTDTTMYDIASLTKVVATTTAVMRLVDDGRLQLDSSVAHYLPEFAVHGKERITVRNLLLHNSGLSAYELFYTRTSEGSAVLDSIMLSTPLYAAGSRTVYSDLGMITLGKVIERVTGESLQRFMREQFWGPLEMDHTMFLPPDSLRAICAPTEVDDYWRHRILQGEVHDENAALLGGIAGHAGVFSTAKDLARFVSMIMQGGEFDGTRYLEKSTIARFTLRHSVASTRALGWDTRSVSGSSSGHYYSMKSYGHTGFTGTSIWVDPVADMAVVFLTNRVHPSRNSKGLPRFRAVLHDAVREAMQEMEINCGKASEQ
ncbi:MAG: glycoside hydrolase family 3 N-terminal domain-containing protein [Bacteroidota bacterium]|nr:glycoside hydrolase family 3 N-terminal domain-containing protein [Bacteroidota bacterium]